jgi:Ca-activated chloride channel family protein
MNMKSAVFYRTIFSLVIFLWMGTFVQAGNGDSFEDRTLSPYFIVLSDEMSVDQLPLKSTLVDVNISGVIADVRVSQVYENQGQNPIEAIYIFPASTRAAVYGMKMTIGERTIVADIKTREDARREYEQAKQEGRSASLLEQHRPNVFQMNVANILPSDVIEVELFYTELLVPVDAVYEFVYPTVVGPRYSNQSVAYADRSEKWVENPYLHEGELPPYTFDINVNLSAGMPIQDIVCLSHKTTISYEGQNFAMVELDQSDTAGGNRDFICKYRLSGGVIDTGLLLYEGQDENFFLMMVQPPKQVRTENIPPREYIFIVDVSGSMHGFPLDVSKSLLKDLIGGLRSFDTFNVLLFAGGSSVLAEQSLPANPQNIKYALEVIERQRGGGGTELLPALKKALSLPGAKGRSRTVVIATDGYVSVEKEAFELIRNNLGTANMVAFGIGSSVNRYIIEGMARAGMGEPFVLTRPEEAKHVAGEFRKLLATPVLTDIALKFDGFDAYDVEPSSIPDVFANRPVVVFGKWRGIPRGTISIQGITGREIFFKEADVSLVSPLQENSALLYLWARHRIAVLSDYNKLGFDDESVSEVRSLGLMYHLLTDYTSFVAVDSQVRLSGGETVTVKQQLPLPRGVSNYAVGGGMRAAKMSAPGMHLFTAVSDETVYKEAGSFLEEKTEGDKPAPKNNVPPCIHVELKKVTVSGGLNKVAAKKIVEANIVLMEQCAAAEIKNETRITCILTVDAGGRVKDVNSEKDSVLDLQTRDCIMNILKQIRFPSSKDSLDTEIKIVLSVK